MAGDEGYTSSGYVSDNTRKRKDRKGPVTRKKTKTTKTTKSKTTASTTTTTKEIVNIPQPSEQNAKRLFLDDAAKGSDLSLSPIGEDIGDAVENVKATSHDTTLDDGTSPAHTTNGNNGPTASTSATSNDLIQQKKASEEHLPSAGEIVEKDSLNDNRGEASGNTSSSTTQTGAGNETRASAPEEMVKNSSMINNNLGGGTTTLSSSTSDDNEKDASNNGTPQLPEVLDMFRSFIDTLKNLSSKGIESMDQADVPRCNEKVFQLMQAIYVCNVFLGLVTEIEDIDVDLNRPHQNLINPLERHVKDLISEVEKIQPAVFEAGFQKLNDVYDINKNGWGVLFQFSGSARETTSIAAEKKDEDDPDQVQRDIERLEQNTGLGKKRTRKAKTDNKLNLLNSRFLCRCFDCLRTGSLETFSPIFQEVYWKYDSKNDEEQPKKCERSSLIKIKATKEYADNDSRRSTYKKHSVPTTDLSRYCHYALIRACDFFPQWDDNPAKLKKAKRKDLQTQTPASEKKQELCIKFDEYFEANTPQGVYFFALLLPLRLFLFTYLLRCKYEEVAIVFQQLVDKLQTFREGTEDPTFQYATFLEHLISKLSDLQFSKQGNNAMTTLYERRWGERRKSIIKKAAAKEKAAKEKAATEEAAKEKAATEEAATEEAAKEDSAVDDAAATEEAAKEDSAVDDAAATEETVDVLEVSTMLGDGKADELSTHITAFVERLFNDFSVPNEYFGRDDYEETTDLLEKWLKDKFFTEVSAKIDVLFHTHPGNAADDEADNDAANNNVTWTPPEDWADVAAQAKQTAKTFIEIAIELLAKTLFSHLEDWRGFFEKEYLLGL